ncbi:MAG: isoleucine--tRNA ligase [Deltaproteobacteria bacterium]|nr:isoleucine--tRNA ligase [Deltaproteobacteria bacterium]
MAAENPKGYKDTLNLPKTDFPMRASLPRKEPERLQKWADQDIYRKILEARAGKETYILHDGPPYANGNIHMGTALNKILKDFVVKSKWMAGKYSHYVPGWDCHGLPIEHKVDTELKARETGISAIEIRRACRDYANHFIDIQRTEFRRLGVFGDWDHPYLTMAYPYEARITREFGAFVQQGSVYKRRKPVYWCSSCGTALAEAEVEYHDHTSPSIYVKFTFMDDPAKKIPELKGIPSAVAIWTTTPWTIPANLAIALHPDFSYVAFLVNGEALIAAEDLASHLASTIGAGEPEIIARFPGKLIEGLKTRHPLYDRESIVVLADYVTLDAGTGCVHTAPGHGQDDYETGLRYGLDVYAPVDDEGKFTSDVGFFAGTHVFKANRNIIEKLEEIGALLAETPIEHTYPHCWRCDSPIIFRATEQWFISMEHNGLRSKALEAINKVRWIPSWGRQRIYQMIENRPDWCISRQRSWGSPITIFYCEECGEALMSGDICNHVADQMEEKGADVWFTALAGELLPEGTKCRACGGVSFKKDMNILDVWFDSGASYAAVLQDRDDLEWPCDMYLEGSDQHRGWFHSSLLESVGTRGEPPYREVLTHGYVVDGNGRKMSKSLGNVIAPQKIIDKYGAEIIRLWVSATDYRDDIRISDEILLRLTEAYRRIRNTCRYLLGNLSDFDPEKDSVPYDEMDELDRWALLRLSRVTGRIVEAYDTFQYHNVFHTLHNFCVVDLSNFYLDILKDRMYASEANSPLRQSGQTAFLALADGIVRLMAPILSFTSEEVWENLPGSRAESVFLTEFPRPDAGWADHDLENRYEKLVAIRDVVTKALEEDRRLKKIGNSLEAAVTLHVTDRAAAEFLESFGKGLPDLFIVSSAAIESHGELPEDAFTHEGFPGFGVTVGKAEGGKCERCWKFAPEVGADGKDSGICARCQSVIEG